MLDFKIIYCKFAYVGFVFSNLSNFLQFPPMMSHVVYQVPFIFTAITVTSFDIEFVFYIFSHTVFNFNLNMIYLYFFLKTLTKIKHVIQSQLFTNIKMYFQITNKTRCIKIYVVMKASRNLFLCLTSVTSSALKKTGTLTEMIRFKHIALLLVFMTRCFNTHIC